MGRRDLRRFGYTMSVGMASYTVTDLLLSSERMSTIKYRALNFLLTFGYTSNKPALHQHIFQRIPALYGIMDI